MKKKLFVLTLFPDFFRSFLEVGVVGKALRESGGLELISVDIRDYSLNRYGSVDDHPFGGGPGMVMKADVLSRALWEGVLPRSGKEIAVGDLENFKKHFCLVYPCPQGRPWNNQVAREFSDQMLNGENDKRDLIFLCGRYEGVDGRFVQRYGELMFSLGDFVLSGGELAVMAMMDSALRFSPGVLGSSSSFENDSFEDGLIEGAHYTRPRVFEGMEVPEVFLSGHHQKIASFQKRERQEITKTIRPDLLQKKDDKEVSL